MVSWKLFCYCTFRKSNRLPHKLSVVGVVVIVALRAAPEDAGGGLALFVDVVDDDGGLQALPVFALYAFKETKWHGKFDIVTVGCFFADSLAIGWGCRCATERGSG